MWKLVQCAVQGRGHIKENVPCQDKTYKYIKGDVCVSALADGAGSAKLSHYGAEDITQFMCRTIAENFDLYFNNEDGKSVKMQMIEEIDFRLKSLVSEMKCEISDLSSTLLITAVKEDKYIIVHIGDGIIGYLKNDELKIASQPENGEFVNTTIFTTSRSALQTMKLLKGYLGSINGFVSMSDGSAASLYDKRQNRIADIIKKIMKMTSYIDNCIVESQLRVSFDTVVKQSTLDDCSISIMFNSSFPGYKNLSLNEKEKILMLDQNDPNMNRKFKKYDRLIFSLETPQSLKGVSRKIHLKPKYTKKLLLYLININLIEFKDGMYRSILIM